MVMDFLNKDHALATLNPMTTRDTPDQHIVENRRYDEDSKRIVKTIRIENLSSKKPVKELTESVRAYSPDELEELYQQAGLEMVARYGNLKGEPFSAESSERCVLVAEKNKIE